MLTIEKIIEMWKKDSVIEENDLDDASIKGAKLHSKYLEIYSAHRIFLKRKERSFEKLLEKKVRWYQAKMSKEEMDELGWGYDPTEGLSAPKSKAETERWLQKDDQLKDIELDIEELKITIDTLKEILENIKWRHQNIKNAIDWRRFTSGV